MSRREAPPSLEADQPAFAERPFDHPWQAEAFALAVALNERGVFTWPEWAEALSKEVNRRGAAADGHDYYEHWLAVLEKLLAAKAVALPADVDRLAAAWERAAHATPHGKPILLENDPSAV